jgi:hypothetical protein
MKSQDELTQTPWPSGDLKGAQLWSHRVKLETQVSQAAQSHTIHSEFKTISPYLFPLKSWLALNPVDWNHIGHRGPPPSVVWKETPESFWGCTLPGSSNLCRLQGQGAGTHCPTGHGSLYLSGAFKMLQENHQPARTRLKPRWMEERKFIMLVDQHLDLSKMAPNVGP